MEDRAGATLTFLLLAPAAESAGVAVPPGAADPAALLRAALAGSSGDLFHTGFPLAVAFPVASDALRVARAVGAALLATAPGRGTALALHSGAAPAGDSEYQGPTLLRAARLLGLAYSGQVLVSAATAALLAADLPPDVCLAGLGAHRLADLQRAEQIFQLQAPGLPADFPPLRSLDARPTNLPAQATQLIGRGAELAAVADLVRRPEVRLVTLTGPGGTGKTRLSLQVAADLLGAFPDGAWFVELETITAPAEVPAAIAGVLGVREAGTAPILATLQAYLRSRRLLLVMDNCEHVVTAAPLVGDLLDAAPGIKVLATSRRPLRLSREQQYPVPPLARPDPRHLPPPAELTGYEAVELFVARARDARPDFTVTAENAAAVAAICERLDGLPLALELAAARVKVLPPGALLGRLEHGLQVLTGGARDRTARQQTLRGAIAWSHDLLEADERVLFRRLAVFAGGATLDAIEGVVGDLWSEAAQAVDTEQMATPTQPTKLNPQNSVLDMVSGLVDQSLLRQEERSSGEPRFVLLETIHEYARERLAAAGEEAAGRAAHMAYFLAWAERVEPHLKGRDQGQGVAQVEEELDNLRLALSWALEQPDRAETALRLATALWRFWHVRGYQSEGRRWLEAGLALGQAVAPALRAEALNVTSILRMDQGDYAAARAGLEPALALYRQAGNRERAAIVLSNLALVAKRQGDYAAARTWQEEVIAFSRERGDRAEIAMDLLNLGDLALQHCDYTEAQACLDECLTTFRALDDKQHLAYVMGNLALLANVQGQLPLAEARARESIALFREVGDKLNLIEALVDLAAILHARGEYSTARPLLEESLTSAREQATRPMIARALEGYAELAAATGRPAQAVQWCAAAAALRQVIGDPLWPDEATRIAQLQATARGAGPGGLRPGLGGGYGAAAGAGDRGRPPPGRAGRRRGLRGAHRRAQEGAATAGDHRDGFLPQSATARGDPPAEGRKQAPKIAPCRDPWYTEADPEPCRPQSAI